MPAKLELCPFCVRNGGDHCFIRTDKIFVEFCTKEAGRNKIRFLTKKKHITYTEAEALKTYLSDITLPEKSGVGRKKCTTHLSKQTTKTSS